MHGSIPGMAPVLFGIACSLAWDTPACAQAYPAKPLRMLFGYTAGGTGDIVARLLAQNMAESLGQNVVVENRPGAGGAIADELAARSPADGYTLLFAAGSSAILPALRAKLPYDIERDFAPISLVVITSFALTVHPSVPVRGVRELIALSRARANKLTYASPGVGSSAHFAAEVFNMLADVRMLHVPYRGPKESATAVLTGEVDAAFPSVTVALPFVSAGKLKALAVTSAKRAALLPSVPTLNEAGVEGYQRAGWNGVLAPAAVPKDVIGRLNAVIVKAINTPHMKDAFGKQGLEGQPSTPEQFGAFIRREMSENARVVKFAGIRIE